MKIGILGGTFDPPHIGHLVIADQAHAQLELQKVWFAPVGTPPHKNALSVSSVNHRVAMTSLAIRDNPDFELTLEDVERPTPHYITTLFEALYAKYSSTEWYLIIGGDSLVELPRWHQPERLLRYARLAVAHRPGFQPDIASLEIALPGISQRIVWVDSPMIDLASHDLQRRASRGLPLRYMVTQDVAQYIERNQLYQRIIP